MGRAFSIVFLILGALLLFLTISGHVTDSLAALTSPDLLKKAS